jgi:peroxiredoxin
MSLSTCKQRTHYDVIGEDGRILQAYAKVDPKTHLEQVLSDLTAS